MCCFLSVTFKFCGCNYEHVCVHSLQIKFFKFENVFYYHCILKLVLNLSYFVALNDAVTYT